MSIHNSVILPASVKQDKGFCSLTLSVWCDVRARHCFTPSTGGNVPIFDILSTNLTGLRRDVGTINMRMLSHESTSSPSWICFQSRTQNCFQRNADTATIWDVLIGLVKLLYKYNKLTSAKVQRQYDLAWITIMWLHSSIVNIYIHLKLHSSIYSKKHTQRNRSCFLSSEVHSLAVKDWAESLESM